MIITAGGWIGTFQLLYTSMNEYLLLFATPLGTSGHSGLYWGSIHDWPLRGVFCHFRNGHYEQVCECVGQP